MFYGENLTAKKHIQAFEHFTDLFEIEHNDVYLRAFAQSLQGDVKEWFRHLHPRSISSWEELRYAFLNFLGEGKSLDQHLSEFHAMKIQKDENVSMFNRRFSAFYSKMPKEIQPFEVVSILIYVMAFHPYLALLLMERNSTNLQQMFNDSQEIEDNLRACGKYVDHICNEDLKEESYEPKRSGLDAEEHDQNQ